MTEILTESFCERCGTRYTFETARPRNSRLGRARTFTKGVRNFVLSDDPFSVAMAEARGEEERNATAIQLDAFHKTFNFCMSCRQYTCSTCWNVEDGRCLSCAPRPGSELVEEVGGAEDAAVTARLAALAAPQTPVHESIGIASWPEADLAQRPAPEAAETVVEAMPAPVDAAPAGGASQAGGEAEAADLPAAEAEAVEPAAVAAVVEAEPLEREAAPEQVVAEPIAEAAAEPATAAEVGGEPVAEAEAVEPAAAGEGVAAAPAELVRPAPIQGLKPGESLDDAIAAYEAALAQTDDAAGAAPVAAEPELVLAPEAEPVVLEAVDDVVPEAVVVPEVAPEGLEAVEVEPVATAAVEPEAVVAAEAVEAASAVQPEPEQVLEAEPAPEQVLEAEPAPVQVLEAEPELAVVAEPEPEIAAEPEPAVAAAVAAPVPEPITPALAPVPEPEPIAAIAAPMAEPVATPPVATPPAAQPSTPAVVPMAPGWLTVAPDDGTAPVWPQQANWPSERQASDRMFAGRRMLPTGNAASVWAASAREVLEAGPLPGAGNVNAAAASPGAQPCIGCGLPLSANARFCRRCGARQG